MQTQIRCRRMRRLIRVSIVCRRFSHFSFGICRSNRRTYLKLELDSSNILCGTVYSVYNGLNIAPDKQFCKCPKISNTLSYTFWPILYCFVVVVLFFLLVVFFLFVCLFVLMFYGLVNPIGSCRAWSVYLTTCLLGRLSPLCG